MNDAHGNVDVELKRSLDWMLVLPGMDHLRYNAAKSIIDVYWNVYFEPICQELGYESPKALLVAHNCTDLHKADQILALFLESSAQTLVKHYQDHEKSKFGPSCDGFLEFIHKTKNNNQIMLRDAAFRHVLGYFVLKAGIRKCNYNYFQTGKEMVSSIFFYANHPLYRKIYLYFDMDVAMMPDYAYTIIKQTIGMKTTEKGSQNDEDSVGEHIDFHVEAINKRIKAGLTWAPSYYLWLAACRTYSVATSLTKTMNKWFNYKRYYLVS